MSLASRHRDYCRRYLNGFATLADLRAWQTEALAAWIARSVRPSLVAANQAITFFDWEDGCQLARPTQVRLDALWVWGHLTAGGTLGEITLLPRAA